MERRYQVFVSSTFLDLKDERAAVVAALLQLEAFPAGMELFPAADDDAWTLIERVIRSSDYYLLVIGGKYGSVDPDSELSYTEKEYDLAVALKKPVMAFLHGDPDAIEFGKSEKDDATRKKLLAFRSKVEQKKHVKYWTSAEGLGGQVALSYANFRQTYPAIGWIRGDVQTATETLTELNDLRKQLELAEQRLESVRTSPPPGTDRFSQGSEEVTFTVDGSTTIRLETDKYFSKSLSITISAAISWDEIFSAVGPTLLDEASEDIVYKRVNQWLTKEYASEVRRSGRTFAAEDGEAVGGFRETRVALGEDDFGTVLIQLRALGLITRSERKRSVKDTGTYWTLTPYGDEHLTALRAIRKEESSEAEDQEEDGNEDEDEE